MNWKRIWTGTLVATFTMMIVHMITGMAGELVMLGGVKNFNFILQSAIRIFPSSLINGFIVTWLYVLARPRLGPGPKTAVIIGTLAYLLAIDPFWGSFLLHGQNLPLNDMVILFGWFGFVSATYLAGWQYIEKSPE